MNVRKKNRRREVCGDASPPKLQPWRPPPFRPHPSVYTLAYINWISFDPIPALECSATLPNRLKAIHASLNSTPTNIHDLRECEGRLTPRIVRSMGSCRGIQSVFVFAGVTLSLLHTSV